MQVDRANRSNAHREVIVQIAVAAYCFTRCFVEIIKKDANCSRGRQ